MKLKPGKKIKRPSCDFREHEIKISGNGEYLKKEIPSFLGNPKFLNISVFKLVLDVDFVKFPDLLRLILPLVASPKVKSLKLFGTNFSERQGEEFSKVLEKHSPFEDLDVSSSKGIPDNFLISLRGKIMGKIEGGFGILQPWSEKRFHLFIELAISNPQLREVEVAAFGENNFSLSMTRDLIRLIGTENELEKFSLANVWFRQFIHSTEENAQLRAVFWQNTRLIAFFPGDSFTNSVVERNLDILAAEDKDLSFLFAFNQTPIQRGSALEVKSFLGTLEYPKHEIFMEEEEPPEEDLSSDEEEPDEN